MQQVNENMEDLFRKAAENYPLNTDTANWDEIAARLNTLQPSLPVTRKKDERKISRERTGVGKTILLTSAAQPIISDSDRGSGREGRCV